MVHHGDTATTIAPLSSRAWKTYFSKYPLSSAFKLIFNLLVFPVVFQHTVFSVWTRHYNSDGSSLVSGKSSNFE